MPKSPLSLLGEWWYEKESYRQYGAIYPLIKEELDQVPEDQWVEKVTEISKHFAYTLVLKKRKDTNLSDKTYAKLDDKGYALTKFRRNSTLVFTEKDSDFILYVSLFDNTSALEEFEKDTRGFRYFLNKTIKQSENPEKDFERLKKYFSLNLKMVRMDEFKTSFNDKKLLDTLIKKKLYIDYEDSNMAYLISDNNQFVITITNANTKATYRRYYNYLSFLVPALLLAIGALIWIYLFRREFNKLSRTAKLFGDGQFDSRINLSKNSALYPIAGSFNDMASRIQTLLEGHKDLTNAVSHEFKTPLSRLNFALEMQKISKTEKERLIYTDKIEQNIIVLEGLVDELLNYTRMQRQQKVEMTSQSVKLWLENEIALFSDYHQNIEIDTDITINKNIAFNSHLMSRALNNLLNNSVEYSSSKPQKIRISAFFDDEEINLIVEDNGIGIAKQDQQRIFEPFTRLDTSRKRSDHEHLGGFGMGLAIVQSIMKQHQGKVTCESSSLGGAKISLVWSN